MQYWLHVLVFIVVVVVGHGHVVVVVLVVVVVVGHVVVVVLVVVVGHVVVVGSGTCLFPYLSSWSNSESIMTICGLSVVTAHPKSSLSVTIYLPKGMQNLYASPHWLVINVNETGPVTLNSKPPRPGSPVSQTPSMS